MYFFYNSFLFQCFWCSKFYALIVDTSSVQSKILLDILQLPNADHRRHIFLLHLSFLISNVAPPCRLWNPEMEHPGVVAATQLVKLILQKCPIKSYKRQSESYPTVGSRGDLFAGDVLDNVAG